MLRLLPQTKDYLGETLPQSSVVIDLGETEILKGKTLEARKSILYRKIPRPDP